MSWSTIPPGLTVDVNFDDSIQRYVQQETIFCPGDPPWTSDATIPYSIMAGALDEFDSYAADHIAGYTGSQLVQIYIAGSSSGGGMSGGWTNCGDYRSGVPITPGAFGSVEITGGPSSELRAIDTGDLRPILNPSGSQNTPLYDSYFMRPTAHTWDGQDPTNDANRSCWLPSEVIGLIGTVRLRLGIGGSGYDFYYGTGIRALHVTSGRPPDTIDPIICFV